jgi:diaminohydroxyphosphoribosylaminopyrimidine deaminase / 5-amino-6-(5-phosphoribosylamino)uracil reductase
MADATFMRRALALARRGWGQTAPNPMVGAVVVKDGRIVGEGYHAQFGGDHAEVVALRTAGENARGATAFVTLEPCAHHGQTPPCTDALVAAGVRRVVIAAPDPNPVATGGHERLRTAGIDVDVGVGEVEARELNAAFFHRFTSDRPWVTLKLAVSLDAAIADGDRAPGWLTGETARREVHLLRAGHDAIAVGMGTVRADDPLLTVRGVREPRVPPVRVVFSRTGVLPPDSRLAQSARETPVLVFAVSGDAATRHAVHASGVEVQGATSLRDALRRLRQREVHSIFVEGGAEIAGALLSDSLVDRLIIFQAPVILGAGAVPAFGMAPGAIASSARRLRLVTRRTLDDDLMSVFAFDQD